MTIGKCLLTGANGTFVKSHLTPQALTRPETPGTYFVNAGNRTRPTRTFTSWYDKNIVTRKGEDILSDLDNRAISKLRKHQLVWSGWNEHNILDTTLHEMFSPTQGIRSVTFENANEIRLFFLSILWRWSVSKLPAAAEINLSQKHQDQLRAMILSGDSGNPLFFPISFVQLSTRGETHNMGPLLDSKRIQNMDTEGFQEIPFYRFYFDGLAIHFGMPSDTAEAGNLILGVESTLTFPTITYEASFQAQNLLYVKQDVLHEFPDAMLRLM